MERWNDATVSDKRKEKKENKSLQLNGQSPQGFQDLLSAKNIAHVALKAQASGDKLSIQLCQETGGVKTERGHEDETEGHGSKKGQKEERRKWYEEAIEL